MSGIIGYIIESLRTKNNLTHGELARKVSLQRRQVIEIENDNVEPSEELLNKMSDIFRFDILTVIGYRDVLTKMESYQLYVDIRLAIYHFDVRRLAILVDDASNNDDFMNGETFQLLCHARGLIAIHVEKNFDKAISICKEGINVFYEIDYEKLSNIRLTDYTYSLLISLTVCYSSQNDIEQCKLIADNALHSIKHYVFDDSKPLVTNKHILQKCYVMLINNAAHFNFNLNNYYKTLELIEEGIPKCKEFSLYNILAYFQHLKFESLYCLGKYEEAQENYNLLKTICTITSYGELMIEALKAIKQKYPKIKP